MKTMPPTLVQEQPQYNLFERSKVEGEYVPLVRPSFDNYSARLLPLLSLSSQPLKS
jgi:hypothetical protein